MASRQLINTLLAILCGAALLCAQITPGENLIGELESLEQRPRLSGDWVTYTQDYPGAVSNGRVIVENLLTGERHDLGPGFGSDIDVWTGAGALSPEGCATPELRVAWLRLNPQGQISVHSACLQAGAWTPTVLLGSTRWADELRVERELTVWSGANAQRWKQPLLHGLHDSAQVHPLPAGGIEFRPEILLHDGEQIHQLSVGGNAFRPEILRKPAGDVLVFWDQYLAGTEHLDYEIFVASRRPGQDWSSPRNLSLAPASTDMAPSPTLGANGMTWLSWRTDRGSSDARLIVARVLPNFELLFPQPYPPSSDPSELGLFDPPSLRKLYEPVLRIDATGRPWLFLNHLKLGSQVYDKELLFSTYSGSNWTPPEPVSINKLDDLHLDAEPIGQSLRVVYQTNSAQRRSVDIGWRDLPIGPAGEPAELFAPRAAPQPHEPYDITQLPLERTLEIGGQVWRLVFADLHSHTKRSPDAMGTLDNAYFWARDIMRIDVLGSTDHDERTRHWLTDWEYELGRRFHALFRNPDFLVMHGFEWTSNTKKLQGEFIGHRATIDSSRVYRNTDPNADELAEYYALMLAEDAIGVPHHLGKLGGATFLLHDPQVQPITEIASVHGVFEDAVHEKLTGEGARFALTAAGDDHTAQPGRNGLAGVWIPPGPTLDADEFKDSLRARRTFAVQRDGMWVDFRVNDAPAGSFLEQDGPLIAFFELREVPGDTPFTVNLIRNDQIDTPLFAATYPAGSSPRRLVPIPAHPLPAYYMLRVTSGTGTASKDTRLWSTPVWVDPTP